MKAHTVRFFSSCSRIAAAPERPAQRNITAAQTDCQALRWHVRNSAVSKRYQTNSRPNLNARWCTTRSVKHIDFFVIQVARERQIFNSTVPNLLKFLGDVSSQGLMLSMLSVRSQRMRTPAHKESLKGSSFALSTYPNTCPSHHWPLPLAA